ncbi:MAG: lamin tail domain-containing protein [Tepidisphaeraceae bacterium]
MRGFSAQTRGRGFRKGFQGNHLCQSAVESLEGRRLLVASPVITEFVASNANGLVDGNGAHSDWVEIQNQGDAAIDLAGWRLTDNPNSPAKWTFPSYTLAAGAFMVVIADSSAASGPDSLGYLHANFSLSADGENLSLRRPDGSIASEFAADGIAYPKQAADVSYGTSKILTSATLVVSGAAVKAFVPTTSTLDANQWTLPAFDDSSWTTGTAAVGFDGGGTASAASLLARWYAPAIGAANNSAVSSWNASTGTGSATQSTSANRPTYRTNQINGKAVVHFDGSNDNLKITNQSLNGLADFTVAMVFRTSTAGRAGTQWYNNTGIVDAEVGGVTNDWGLAVNDAGSIGAGVGNPDTTLYSASNLNNGQAHVVVFTKAGTTTALSIDGGIPVYGTASATARNVNELVFGSLHTNVNYFNGDIGEVRLYSTAINDDAVRSLGNAMGSDWGVAQTPGVYTPKLGLDLQSDMANLASTANIRVPFTVANPSQLDTLFLNMKYDDGFIAYLNGTEIARRNAPGGAITYTSTASAARSDAAAQIAESIDVSAFINLLQGGGATNILAIKALNVSATDSDLLIAPELVGSASTLGNAFMTTPTPGAANLPGYAGFASDVTFSVSHGYFNAPFSTTLTTTTPGATIVYTLDGSTPSLTNGVQVVSATNAPTTVTLNISSTTVLRAAAFKNTFVPSNVTAASYFFTADIVQQPEATPAGAYWDVGMDSDVVNAQQTYSVQQALTAVPTMSLTIDNSMMFGTASGLYTHPLEKGDDWERPVSIEYFDPNNANAQFSINAGIRISGAVSRDPSRPKKSFKIFFRSEYGESKLNYPMFGTDNAQTVFDHLILRAGHSYSWANLGGTPYQRADYLRDEFARSTQEVLTGDATRGNFLQLYINGQYWGLYNAVEDVDQDWAAAHYGGNAEDYDIIKPDDVGGVIADDGNLDLWNNLFNTADEAYADGVIDNAEYAGIAAKVDVKALVDYMLDVFYRGDNDAPVLIGSMTSPRNFIALVNRADPNAKMQFQTQDGEISLDTVGYDRTEVYGNQNPGRLYQQLRTNPEFRQLVIDEVQRNFTGNGVLTVAANKARYQALMNQINVAIVGESAHWGNAKQSTPGMRDTDWVTETNWVLNSYMPLRTNIVLTQLKNDFPELNTAAPTVLVNGVASTGGVIAAGASVTLADSNSPTGTIYYTLDGSDPRSTGGGVSGGAIAYSGAFTLNAAKTVNARVLKGGVWSSLQTAVFTIAPPSLRLAEMMYHPAAPVAGGPFAQDDYEYLVLANTGSTPIDLGGMQFTAGIVGTFASGVTLAPGIEAWSSET